MLVENQVRFQHSNYGSELGQKDSRLVKESRVKWIPIYSNLNVRKETIRKIRVTEIEMQDMRAMHADDLTAGEEEVFSVIDS